MEFDRKASSVSKDSIDSYRLTFELDEETRHKLRTMWAEMAAIAPGIVKALEEKKKNGPLTKYEKLRLQTARFFLKRTPKRKPGQ